MKIYFNQNELGCRCGKCNLKTIKEEIIAVLQIARIQLKKPLTVTSGARCPTHNKNEKGSPTSLHVTAEAVDISMANLSNKERLQLISIFLKNGATGFGIHFVKNFIHFSFSDKEEGMFKY